MDIELDLDMLWRMLLSVLLGGIIGMEREWFNKSAGFRTMILICMGATVFTMCSQQLGLAGDHSRIASNIVVGVGFIGGGVIFKGEGGVNGITTAACIWVTAAIGMLVGSMHWELACVVTAVAVIVLFVLSFVEGAIGRANSVRRYHLVCGYTLYKGKRITALARTHRLHIRGEQCRKEAGLMHMTLQVQGHDNQHRAFIQEVLNEPGVDTFEF